MEELLQRFVDGTLGRDEARLYDAHCAHFCRRARLLDPSFFPGREKSKEGARSLANGAYASFAKEPQHEGDPAFVHAVRKAYSPAKGFLYYWRDSAAIRFLRSEGSELLRARANIQRNVRIHLRESFHALVPSARWSQVRWGLPEWPESAAGRRSTNIEQLHVSFKERGTKALIRAVLEAAEAPLTAAEIAAVIERAHGFAREEPATGEFAEVQGDTLRDMMSTGVLDKRVEDFWSTLDDDERRLLIVRGYAEGEVAKVSFREVAEKLGGFGGESYRLKERKIFERLRDTFTPEEMDIVVRALVSRLAAMVSR